MNLIIGCDVETTGLDACADDMLEIALAAIDLQSFRIVARYEARITPTETGLLRLRENDFVLQMHEGSGLLHALTQDAKPLEQVERECCEFFDLQRGVGQGSPLFGTNPSFDRKFLEVHMPELARKFHYRSFDTNCLMMLRKALEGAETRDLMRVKGGTAHRAMADIEQSVAHVHDFLTWMGSLSR